MLHTLSDIHAEGSVVCMGRGCSVAFEDAVFDRCSLVVREGAQVTVNGSKFQGKESPWSGISVFVDGEHTAVEMNEVAIHGGKQGVAVRSQASFKGVSLTLNQVKDMGLECTGLGSTMDLRDVSITGFDRVGTMSAQFVAVHVIDQGHAQLIEVMMHMTPYEVGVHASGHAFVEMNDSTVSASVLCCAFSGGSTGKVSGCEFDTYGTCITLQDENTSMDAHDCHFSCFGARVVAENWGDANCGVMVRNGARCKGRALSSTGFDIDSGPIAGYVVYTNGEMECTNSDSSDNAHGCVVFGGTLRASNLLMKNNKKYGCWVQNRGLVVLQDCTAENCGKNGVTVRNAGSRVDMKNCKLVGNRQIGVLAHESGLVQARNCSSSKHELAGYWAQKYGRMEVISSTSDEDRRGCGFAEAGQLFMHKVVVDGVLQPDSAR